MVLIKFRTKFIFLFNLFESLIMNFRSPEKLQSVNFSQARQYVADWFNRELGLWSA